jgi:hypothetical protein
MFRVFLRTLSTRRRLVLPKFVEPEKPAEEVKEEPKAAAPAAAEEAAPEAAAEETPAA